MNYNNIKIIYRDFKRNKLYSSIKIGGFALGIATCMLIGLFIRHELSYDQHYQNSDRIFRVVAKGVYQNQSYRALHHQAPFAGALEKEIPEIEKAGRLCCTRLFGAGENSVRRSEQTKVFHEKGFAYADQNLIEILELPFIQGDKFKALKEANNVIIHKKIADKLFPGEDPIGKTLVRNENTRNPLTITGVFGDFPGQTHVNFEYVVALYDNIFNQINCWDCTNHITYVQTKPGTNVSHLQNKMRIIYDNYIVPYEVRIGTIGAVERYKKHSYELQSVKDVHLNSTDLHCPILHDYGDMRTVYMLGAIALFILIIACINFINLTTAKSVNRAKEIGLKKTIGARRNILIRQFFTESIFYSVISVVIAIGLAWLFLPFLNKLSVKDIDMPWGQLWFIPKLFTSAILIGVLAGIYPSLYLTSFKPVKTLKGVKGDTKNIHLRNGLVVFQFAASILLLIGTMVIYRQVNFMLNKELGFNKEQVLLLHGTNTLGNKLNVLKTELKKLPEVKNVSISSYLPYKDATRNSNAMWNEGKSTTEKSIGGQNWIVDEEYLPTLGIKLVEGRNFTYDNSIGMQQYCLVNQELVEQLGLDNPLGKWVETSFRKWEIIGVVEDFHYNSLGQSIGPLLMRYGRSAAITSIRMETPDMADALKSVKQVWSQIADNQTMNYSFLDHQYAMMYDRVQRTGKIFRSFSILAIIIACLGLYGLAEFITKERTKEIGVRKVNGAKVIEILAALNKGFVVWVIIALFVACPTAWYLMDRWLENYAYRVDISWWIFVVAGSSAIAVAVLTVSWQSWRAARRNPVEALRYE
ncbi:MAG: ABC transporter permease [Bacteroidales bacterium]|nr:ABC transporter permease [Bacteroidales bacterium]